MTLYDKSRIAIQSAFLAAALIAATTFAACSSTSANVRATTPEPGGHDAGTAAERLLMPEPGRLVLEAVEGPLDTVDFHIGSPLFLRLRVGDPGACTPGEGEFFYFDAGRSQLGWNFEEVSDSLLFPTTARRCERILMLSSDASNRLAEGRFTMRAELFMTPTYRLSSDLIALHPFRSVSGADEQSYARFLQEQIVRNAAHLRDPQTLAALFGEGVPTSAESEIYRAVIMYRSGDLAAAADALTSSATIARDRRRPLSLSASYTREALRTRLGSMAPEN